MNRWLVALLVTLAVIVLVAPGIVGRMAEKSVEESLNLAASENDDIVVTTENFERGWFTSEGRHRIELRDGPVRALFENGSNEIDHAPSLIIDTHIDHGLLPVSSMSRDSGSLKPGLASTVSTMKLDPGNGELFDIPGKIYSDVGLTGAIASRFLLQAGSDKFDDKTVEWQGADVIVHTDPETGSLAVKGDVSPWAVLAENGGVNFGSLTIDADQEKSRYGLSVGSVRLEAGAITIENDYGPATGFDKLSLDANSELDGDRVNAAAKFDLSGLATPGISDIDIAMNVVLNRLDAQSSQKIAEVLRNAQASADPDDALANMYPSIEADIQRLLAAGLEMRLEQLDITLPGGKLTTKLRFDLPDSDPAAVFSWPALLLALDASADIRLPIELFDMAEALSPDVGMLVAMGVFRKDGEFYEMRAEYAKGLLTVNGVPMPIPLGL